MSVRAKHGLFQESPSKVGQGPLRRGSPAGKRRKVVALQPHMQWNKAATPSRRFRINVPLDVPDTPSQYSDRESLGDEQSPLMRLRDPTNSSQKCLFDTPDSANNNEWRRRRPSRATDSDNESYDSSCKGLDSGRKLSNVNPFCPPSTGTTRSGHADRTMRTSFGSTGDSMDQSYLLMSPSSPYESSSHRLSNADSTYSDSILEDSTPLSQWNTQRFGASTVKKVPPFGNFSSSGAAPPPLALGPGTSSRMFRSARGPKFTTHETGRPVSPTALCHELQRTCSLTSDPESPPRRDDDDVLIDEESVSVARKPGTSRSLDRRRRVSSHVESSVSFTPQTAVPIGTGKSAANRRHTFAMPRAKGPLQRNEHSKASRFQCEFEEQGILGSGTFGTVYRCKNRLDGCMYAIKVTKQRFRGRADRARVLKEVYALSALCNAEDNPHIVRYFSSFIQDGRLYIQTELCDKSLQDMMRAEDFPGGIENVAKDMARQVLEGLARLHKLSLVHLDIKPANIFVKNGTYKIGDLGHACLARIQQFSDQTKSPKLKTLTSSTRKQRSASMVNRPTPIGSTKARLDSECNLEQTPFALGTRDRSSFSRPPLSSSSALSGFSTSLAQLTPVQHSSSPTGDHSLFDKSELLSLEEERLASSQALVQDVEEGDSRYMAPEILSEEYDNLPKGDIFSLGASMYEMCLGRELPQNGTEWQDIRKGVLDDAALSKYSPPLQQLIRSLLCHDASKRPSAESLLLSGGPNGILLTAAELEHAKEKALAEEYRKELVRMRASGSTLDNSCPKRVRRSNTM